MFLVGCGGSDDSSGDGASVVGTWTWSKLTVNGITVNTANPAASTVGGSTEITPAWVTALAAQQGTAGVSVSVVVTINADGTVSGTGTMTAAGQAPVSQALTGTWTTSGDTLSMTIQGYTAAGTYTVTDNKLTVNMSNAQILAFVGAYSGQIGGVPAEYQALVDSLSGSIEFTR